MDETNFDGQPSFTQQAAFPPSWTSADDLRFARKAAGLNQIKSDLDEGVVYPHQVAPLLNQLQGDMGEMSQRKAAFDAHQQQQQQAAAMHQNAMGQAMRQQDATLDASNFQNRTATYTDIATGRTAHFFQHKPGMYEQVDFGEPTQAGGGDTEGAADVGDTSEPAEGEQQAPLGPDGQPLTDQPRFRTVVGPDGVQRGQRIPTLAERQAMDQTTPQDQTRIAGQIGAGTFGQGQSSGGPMSIQNGPYTDQYEGGQLVSTNRPPSPSVQAAQAGLLSDTQLAEFRRQAVQAHGVAPPQFIQGRFGMQHNPAYTQYVKAVDAAAQHLADTYSRKLLYGEKAGIQSNAEDKRQTNRLALQEKKQNADLTTQQTIKLYNTRLAELQKEYDVITKKQDSDNRDNPRYLKPEDRPAWAADRKTMEAEAHKRAREDHAKFYPHRQEDLPAEPAAAQPPASNTTGGNTPAAAHPLAAKDGQQKAFDSLMQQVAAPRPTPPPAKPVAPPFNTETYRKTRVSKFE